MTVTTKPWPPRWLSPVPKPLHTRGPEAIEFVEHNCRNTKDSLGGRAGDLMILRPWQKNLINALLVVDDKGLMTVRSGLVMIPRKNGKSSVTAALALWSLVFGPQGGEVYSVAGDREQAAIVFETAKRMVALDPELSQIITPYRSALVVESTGSSYKVRSADSALAQGLNPTFCIFDEVEVQPNRELWDSMDLGRAARPESLLLGITTAGPKADSHGNDTIAYELYQYGRKVATKEVVDPSFFFACWQPKDEHADWRDPQTWAEANPGLGDILGIEDFLSAILRTPEAPFRTYRLDQWVNSRTSWLPSGAWDALKDEDRDLEPGQCKVVFGFDGARKNDCTAIVLATCEAEPHLKLLKLWEKPLDDPHWRLSDEEVLPVLRQLADEWHPEEIVVDQAYWEDALETLDEEGYPIVRFNQRGPDMVAATEGFYQAVVQKHVTHDGNPALTRHLENTIVNTRSGVARVAKENKESNRKIDAAVAAIMARYRAKAYEEVEPGVESLAARAAGLTEEAKAEMVTSYRERMDALVAAERERMRTVHETAQKATAKTWQLK